MCSGNGKPIMHIPNNYFVMPAERFANALEIESAFINTHTLEVVFCKIVVPFTTLLFLHLYQPFRLSCQDLAIRRQQVSCT